MPVLTKVCSFGNVVTLSLLLVSTAYAERYSVEKDSFGNYSAKKVEVSVSPINADQDAENKLKVEPEPQLKQKTELEAKQEKDSEQDPEPKKLSIFELKYLEAERAEKQRVLDALTANAGQSSDFDATQVNPEDFVDSETLLRSGRYVDKEKSPYYVTVDADGTVRNEFYDPELVKEILFEERNRNIEFTKAKVYDKETSDIALPENADPVALSILRGQSDAFVSYFKQFSERCCSDLPKTKPPLIQFGESYYFTLTDDDLPYRFAEGDSRFLLIKLPDLNVDSIPVRLRSFIRKYAQNNIENGVFFPQLITLDKDREPIRIITGPLLKFQEETWTTYAYLEGIFSLSQSVELDERYLLINTTAETLKSSSTIDMPGSDEKIILKHMNEGSFQIEILQSR